MILCPFLSRIFDWFGVFDRMQPPWLNFLFVHRGSQADQKESD